MSTDTYRGLAFPFRFGPRGHIERASGTEKIRQSLQMIGTTYLGERLYSPEIGTALRSAVFRFNDVVTARLIESLLTEAIALNEPRVRVLDVTTKPDPEKQRYVARVRVVVVDTGDTLDVEVYPEVQS